MDALQAIKERRSVRKYLDREIPKKILEDLVDCGRLAATARNAQPWEFVVVTDKQKLKQISDITSHGKFIANSAACIAVFGKKDATYFLEDGSAATQNILVASKAHNLGSCWVAGYGKDYAEDIKKILSVPEEYTLVSLISLGYPAEYPSKSKRSLEEVLHWEQF
ncbi:MAG: hypothetical protein PWQ82_1126 [Thermosediminibacterales bacterium]|nr:hypothetical protein [Thermosediminibacterales bacterium]MDK2835680.1 hypothetical protein [Thermosediminibacterales bacterium]